MLRCRLRRLFAVLAKRSQRLLRCGNLLIESDALFFDCRDFRLPGAHDSFLLGTFRGQAAQFELRDVKPFAHPCHLRLELLQHVARRHGLKLGVAFLTVEAFEKGTEIFNFAVEG